MASEDFAALLRREADAIAAEFLPEFREDLEAAFTTAGKAIRSDLVRLSSAHAVGSLTKLELRVLLRGRMHLLAISTLRDAEVAQATIFEVRDAFFNLLLGMALDVAAGKLRI